MMSTKKSSVKGTIAISFIFFYVHIWMFFHLFCFLCEATPWFGLIFAQNCRPIKGGSCTNSLRRVADFPNNSLSTCRDSGAPCIGLDRRIQFSGERNCWSYHLKNEKYASPRLILSNMAKIIVFKIEHIYILYRWLKAITKLWNADCLKQIVKTFISYMNELCNFSKLLLFSVNKNIHLWDHNSQFTFGPIWPLFADFNRSPLPKGHWLKSSPLSPIKY